MSVTPIFNYFLTLKRYHASKYIIISIFARFKHIVKIHNRRTYTQIIIKYINRNLHKL